MMQMKQGEKQSLRTFLNELEEGELLSLDVKREDYLFTAIVDELEKKKQFPVVSVTDPETGAQAVCNCFADRKIIGRFIKNVVNVESEAEKYKEPVFMDDAPVHEVVIKGDDVDVLSLPIFRHFEGDAGRYISSGIVVAKDPDTGRCNMSLHRMQLKTKNRIGISLHSRGDLWDYLNRAAAKGEDLPISVVIGASPAAYVAATTKIPVYQDDYSWAAAYTGEPVILTNGVTVDVPVPAYAEYVLEGKILRDDFEDEGPFGEYTGYSTSRSTRNIFEVTAITHRVNPIYQDLVPGYSMEHILLSQYTDEIILLHKMQKEMPQIKAINMPKNGCHFHAYVSIDSKLPGQAKQAMMLLFGLNLYLKLIIMVGPDIDVFDEEQVMWAMATHVQAARDVFIVPEGLCNRLDPSSIDGKSDKMGIDATGCGREEGERVTIPEEVRKAALEMIR